MTDNDRTILQPEIREITIEETSSIRTMSFNIAADLAPASEVIKAIRQESPDLVGLQELGVRQAEAIDRELAAEYPYRLLHPGGYEGKGLLSKHPVHEEQELMLAPNRPDLLAQMLIDGTVVSALVAHPRPPAIGRQGVIYDEVTRIQLDRIVEIATSGGPTVVLGDFNLTPRQPGYAQLVASGLIDAFRETGVEGATLPARVGNTSLVNERWRKMRLRPLIRIDYIWYTYHLKAESAWVGTDGGSDHMPVLATLRWRRGKPGDQ